MASIEENNVDGKPGKILSVNISSTKGTAKKAVNHAYLVENFGLKDDAHSGSGLRQVSLLAIESIRKQSKCPKVKRKNCVLGPGDFAENITTEGVNLSQLKIGNTLKIGDRVILEISKIGKECHRLCTVYERTGDCIMPREGIFAKVVRGGKIIVGNEIEVVRNV